MTVPACTVRCVTVASCLLAVLLAPSIALAQVSSLANGQRIYQTHCAGCHGVSGIAVMPQAPSFARGERLNLPDAVLANTVKTGRAAMPAFFGILGERDIYDVLSYLRTMRR